jgi:hypothetical protein
MKIDNQMNRLVWVIILIALVIGCSTLKWATIERQLDRTFPSYENSSSDDTTDGNNARLHTK